MKVKSRKGAWCRGSCVLALFAVLLGAAACGDDSNGSVGDGGPEGGNGRRDAAVSEDSTARRDAADRDAEATPDGGPECTGPEVARYDTFEVVLQAAGVYDGTGGSPNPFTDVDVRATVTAPDGRTFEVEGFFDGDGAGGNVGDVFKVRVFADQPGEWEYVVHSVADAGLDGRSGRFCVRGTLPGRFGSGPVVVNPAYPRSFMLADGSPIYLVGKFLDVAAPDPIKFSHTMFSEQLTEDDRRAMLDRHVSMGLNKINVYLANRGDYRGVSTTPWLGDADANDKTRFHLGRWHMYDQWVRRIRDAGLVAQLWFFADDSNFGALPDADKQRLIRYGMARLSGYVNTMFTLCLEWQEGWSRQSVAANATFLQEHNPWGRLVSVHGTTGPFAFPNEPWADYMDIQSGNDASHRVVHDMGLANRNLAAKPLINEEFGLGEENDDLRKRAWAAFMAGAAGSGTGAFLQYLAAFAETVPFDRMEPRDELVVSGNAYCLAGAGAGYVVYLYDGGQVSVDLGSETGTFDVSWYDPRTGATSSGGEVSGGAVRHFTAPGSGDFVLRLVER